MFVYHDLLMAAFHAAERSVTPVHVDISVRSETAFAQKAGLEKVSSPGKNMNVPRHRRCFKRAASAAIFQELLAFVIVVSIKSRTEHSNAACSSNGSAAGTGTGTRALPLIMRHSWLKISAANANSTCRPRGAAAKLSKRKRNPQTFSRYKLIFFFFFIGLSTQQTNLCAFSSPHLMSNRIPHRYSICQPAKRC